MPLYLITSVCDEGVYPDDFRLVEAGSREAIAGDMLAQPLKWERFLRNTKLWSELTEGEYGYEQPRRWSAAELLARIDATRVDGDIENQLRIHPVGEVLQIPPATGPAPPEVVPVSK